MRLALLCLPFIFALGCVNSNNVETADAPVADEFVETQLKLQFDHDEIAVPNGTWARAIGGNIPYKFEVLSGDASINMSSGEITPDPTYTGDVTVKVTDKLGLEATSSFKIYPRLSFTPISTVLYTQDEITLTAAGGKPPYVFNVYLGASTELSRNDTELKLKMASYGDTVMVSCVDALGNRSSATILVVEKLSVRISNTLFPSQDSAGNSNKIAIQIVGGKISPSADFIVTKLAGIGTVTKIDVRNYIFEPHPTTIQMGASGVDIQVEDELGDQAHAQFQVFVPHSISVGGLHSCAVENSEGKVKCWGDNIHGQLGYGDDPSSQTMWGDCTGCNEDSRVSTTNQDNFKTVHFLSLAERLAGGTILDYATGEDLMCAVISKDATGLSRDVRCLGYNYIRGYSNRVGHIHTITPEFPFFRYWSDKYFRHRRLNYDSNPGQSESSDFHSLSYLYRFPKASNPNDYAHYPIFPRSFLPLPTSTTNYPFAIPSTYGILFGDEVTTDSNGERYQDPSSFNYLSSYFDSSWIPEKIFVRGFSLSGYRTFYLSSTTTKIRSEFPSNQFANSAPFTKNNWDDVNPLSASITYNGLEKVAFTTETYDDHCFLGKNKSLYCQTSGNWPMCGNNQSGVQVSGADCRKSGVWSPVTTTLGGDADRAFDVSITNRNGAYGCAIFDGNPTVGDGDRLVACWGKSGNNFGNGNTTAEQRYAKAVLKNSDSMPLIGATKILTQSGVNCALIPGNAIGSQLYCWGSVNSGQYQLTGAYTTSQSKAVPISFGANEEVLDASMAFLGGTCAITRNTVSLKKYLRCWGTTRFYGNSIPKPMPGPWSQDVTNYNVDTTDPISVSLSDTYGCMMQSDQKALRCWGDNRNSVLGIDNGMRGNKPGEMKNLPLVALGTGRSAKSLISGLEFNCAILDNDRAKCWGSALYGEVGYGRPVGFGSTAQPGHGHIGINENQMGDNLPYLTFPGDPTSEVATMAAGTNHACALTKSNRLYCWGDNTVGQIGQGSTTKLFTSPMWVELPPGDVKQIALGRDHTCVLIFQVSKNNLYCWGSNLYGQLGMGSLTDALGSSTLHTNDIIGDSASDIQVKNLNPVYVDGQNIQKISASHLNTCVLFTTGRVRCYGKGLYGIIGIGTFDNNSDGVTDDMGTRTSETGYKHLIDFGKDPITKANNLVKDLYVGHSFACVILTDNRAKCWGVNDQGQLGLEDTQNRGSASGEMGDALPYVNIEPGQTVLRMSLGAAHSCAVLSNNKIKCWGVNTSGQLGIDADFDRGKFPFTMGVSLPYSKVGF